MREGEARALAGNPFFYRRRRTRVVMVGDVAVGGDNPIRVQSMTTTRTQDVEATAAQAERLVRAGCEIVRITAPTVRDAKAIGEVRAILRGKGIRVPLVADIHFSPEAALAAADHVDKVRINPGNYADSRKFAVREYTDAEYTAELARIEERVTPLIRRLKERGIALRIGTNHGSLSDRITNRYGDTPRGMVESALEFVRICETNGYRNIILSMKASNPKVMIEAYRLLAAEMAAEDMDYPFHLGVTEAGNGEDARIKSAVGIGALLLDGIGDTVRVSLAEEPEEEIPVAQALAVMLPPALVERGGTAGLDDPTLVPSWDPLSYARRRARAITLGGATVGGDAPAAVLTPGPRARARGRGRGRGRGRERARQTARTRARCRWPAVWARYAAARAPTPSRSMSTMKKTWSASPGWPGRGRARCARPSSHAAASPPCWRAPSRTPRPPICCSSPAPTPLRCSRPRARRGRPCSWSLARSTGSLRPRARRWTPACATSSCPSPPTPTITPPPPCRRCTATACWWRGSPSRGWTRPCTCATPEITMGRKHSSTPRRRSAPCYATDWGTWRVCRTARGGRSSR